MSESSNNLFSIKINQLEGSVEILGNDKEWVGAQLAEVKELLMSSKSNPTVKPSSTPTVDKIANSEPKPTSRKKSSSQSKRAIKNPILADKLTTEVKAKMVSYIGERKANFKSLPAQAAIIATFLQDNIGWDGVDQNDMYTVYSIMGWPAPGNPGAQLNNALSRNQFFSGVVEGKYNLSHKGENFARHDSKVISEQAG